jgi:hypothetical protein
VESDNILLKIGDLKLKMGALWEERGKTDSEILEISVEIDGLLNEYYRRLARKRLCRRAT